MLDNSGNIGDLDFALVWGVSGEGFDGGGVISNSWGKLLFDGVADNSGTGVELDKG